MARCRSSNQFLVGVEGDRWRVSFHQTQGAAAGGGFAGVLLQFPTHADCMISMGYLTHSFNERVWRHGRLMFLLDVNEGQALVQKRETFISYHIIRIYPCPPALPENPFLPRGKTHE